MAALAVGLAIFLKTGSKAGATSAAPMPIAKPVMALPLRPFKIAILTSSPCRRAVRHLAHAQTGHLGVAGRSARDRSCSDRQCHADWIERVLAELQPPVPRAGHRSA